MDADKERRINIRVKPEDFRKLDIRRAERGRKWQELLPIIEAWLDDRVTISSGGTSTAKGEGRTGTEDATRLQSKESVWITKLLTVLSGPARRAIIENLKAFEELTRLKQGDPDAPPPGESAEDAAQKAIEAVDLASEAAEKHIGKRRGRLTGSD